MRRSFVRVGMKLVAFVGSVGGNGDDEWSSFAGLGGQAVRVDTAEY